MNRTFVALISLAIASSVISAKSQELITSGTTKIEEQMAVINANRAVRTDDTTVHRFRFLLSALSSAASEPPSAIGDKLTKSRQLIRENFGKEISLLALTEMAYRNRSALKPGNSSSFFASMIVIYGSE